MENDKATGKFVIIQDLNFTGYMKDEDGKIKTYNTFDEACMVCGMYELPDVLIMEVKFNHIEK